MRKLKKSAAILYFIGGMIFYFAIQFMWVYFRRIPDWEAYFVLSPHPVWIPFTGSIVGGMLTLGGVYLTLRYTRKRDAEMHTPELSLTIEVPNLFLNNGSNDDAWSVPGVVHSVGDYGAHFYDSEVSLLINGHKISMDFYNNPSNETQSNCLKPGESQEFIMVILAPTFDILPDTNVEIDIYFQFEGRLGTKYRQKFHYLVANCNGNWGTLYAQSRPLLLDY